VQHGRWEGQDDALVRVSRLYYEENMPQEQIAQMMNRARSTISRMLAAARDRGIVHIEIRVPFERAYALETSLKDRFGLSDCRVVVAPRGEPQSIEHLGRAAADYLQLLLHDGMTVGVSSGRALASAAKYLKPHGSVQLEVVQIIGAMGHDDPNIDTPDIARALAKAYDAHCRYLHVPLLVDDVQTRRMLLEDRGVSQILRFASTADVALLGVGTLDPRDRSPLLTNFLSQKEIAAIRQAGGVGHICGEHYSATGRRLPIELNDRTIGIGLARLAKIPLKVAVAGGVTKAPAIAAGIRGGYLNTLITDDRAASRMLSAHGL